jgi:peptidoglycan/LPS O-acetylase OafA/YrhL
MSGLGTRMKAVHHRFAVLDAWRGVAACIVALLHFTGWRASHLDDIAFVRYAWLMVDFFFVLSGFVISHAALGKISDARTATIFMIRRFGRLWPLHLAMLAVFVGLALAKSAATHGAVPAFASYHSLTSVFYNLLMIQGLDTEAAWAWNSPSWSIGVEFYTYFIFVGVCLMAANRRFSTVVPALVLIVLALAILVPVGTMESGNIARCIFGFFVGHLTYLIWKRRKNHVPVLEWLALGLALAIVSFGAIKPLQFLAPPVFAFVVWVFAEEAGFLSRLGKSVAMQNLGAWSYSIYMTHWLGIHVLVGFFPWMEARFGTHTVLSSIWAGDVTAILFLAATIVLSSMTYRYIENPARNYFNRLASGGNVRVSRSSSVV